MKFSDAATKNIESVLEVLGGGIHGISSEEAKKRIITYGVNEPESYRTQLPMLFFKQFKSPFVILLLIAAITVGDFVVTEAVKLLLFKIKQKDQYFL